MTNRQIKMAHLQNKIGVQKNKKQDYGNHAGSMKRQDIEKTIEDKEITATWGNQ